MRTKVLVAGLVLCSMAVLAPMQGHCVAHEDSTSISDYKEGRAKAMQAAIDENNAADAKAVKQNEECVSYVQVFDSIAEDPEHAEAHRITPSYAIR